MQEPGEPLAHRPSFPPGPCGKQSQEHPRARGKRSLTAFSHRRQMKANKPPAAGGQATGFLRLPSRRPRTAGLPPRLGLSPPLAGFFSQSTGLFSNPLAGEGGTPSPPNDFCRSLSWGDRAGEGCSLAFLPPRPTLGDRTPSLGTGRSPARQGGEHLLLLSPKGQEVSLRDGKGLARVKLHLSSGLLGSLPPNLYHQISCTAFSWELPQFS